MKPPAPVTTTLLSDVIIGDHATAYSALPFHEDNALGAITQVVAAGASGFVGTMSSTFPALIHRLRCEQNPQAPLWFTADFTPVGPTFVGAEYRQVHPGRYSWNRIGLAIDPDNLAWELEWRESVISPDDGPNDDLPIHTLMCTDTDPYGDWQCQLQEHTWHRVGQPGELVRLVACPDAQTPPPTERSRVVTTTARNSHPDAPEDYPGFNRLWSLQQWLHREQPRGSILILDADMVFRAPVRVVATRGEIAVQQWHGTSVDSFRELLDPVTRDPIADYAPLTWPLVVDCADLVDLLPRWIELTALLRRSSDMWESDMIALIGGVAKPGLTIRYETLGAWM